jgi:hypothetical protein
MGQNRPDLLAAALTVLATSACVRPVAPDPAASITASAAAAGPADPAASASDDCPVAELPRARLWRLTQTQLRNSLQDLFGFSGAAVDSLPAESRLEGFDNSADRLGVPSLLLDRYNTLSEEIASEAVRRHQSLLPCPLADLGQGSCLADFLTRFGRRVWRRPLTEAETTRLAGVYTAAAQAADAENGLRTLVKALLLSPHFLFRSELGVAAQSGKTGGPLRLTDFELASALSYLLWESTPDDTLLELAAAGQLSDRSVLRAQAERLLRSPERAAPAFAGFVRQWMKIDDLVRLRKDRKQFPMYNPATAADLLEENRRFVDSVVFDPGGDRRLHTLLTAPYGYINARTAPIYGIDVPAAPKGAAATALDDNLAREAATLRQQALDSSQRRGIFTHGAFLAAHASSDTPKLVARGSLVREQVLCGEVPPPPDEFKFDDSKITEDMTAREKFVLHTRSSFCARCHALFDGIGFALESYDAIGRFRRTDKDKPIDPSGTLTVAPGRPELRFTNFIDLVGQLADLPETGACFSLQYLTFATGRTMPEVNACEARALARTFANSGNRLDALMLAVVDSPAFVMRRN